jgi:hypothetical protein
LALASGAAGWSVNKGRARRGRSSAIAHTGRASPSPPRLLRLAAWIRGAGVQLVVVRKDFGLTLLFLGFVSLVVVTGGAIVGRRRPSVAYDRYVLEALFLRAASLD